MVMIIKRLTLFTLISLVNLSSLYTQVVNISGQVLRHNGDPLPNVTVTCSNGDSIITDENGSFEFSGLISDQNYQIDGFYETSIFEEITVLDACYNRFMVNQIYNALSSQGLANDFNQDGIYQGLDFTRIANAAIKIENALNELNSPWRFFDSNIDNFNINTSDITPGIYLEELSSDTSGLRLIAVKSGDVAIEVDHQPSPASAPHPTFYFSDMAIEENEEITISLKVRDLENIMGFQHGLAWDTSFLNFIACENKTNVFELISNEAHVEERVFPIMEIDVSAISGAQTVVDDAAIYEVRFQVLKDASSLSGILGFDNSFIQKQVVYLDPSNFTLYLVGAECIIEESEPTATNLNLDPTVSFDISPNPAFEIFPKEFIIYSFKLKKDSIVDLLLSYKSCLRMFKTFLIFEQ